MGTNNLARTSTVDAYPAPVFQAFTIKTTGSRARHQAQRAVRAVLGSGWEITTYAGRGNFFEVYREEGVVRPAKAWELAYRLRVHHGVASAEPVFKAWVTDRKDWGDNAGPAAGVDVEAAIPEEILDWLCGPGENLPKAQVNDWSLNLTQVKQAWTHHFSGRPNKEGEGIIVGHPDTGYRNHPEIATSLLVNQGFDLVDGDTDPRDELLTGFGKSPGHGTATASVIVSPKGPPVNISVPFVSGAAPAAKLIPFRVSDSVVILDSLNLARAIEKAADAGSHVISISMGGLGSQRLHDAVVYATNKGAIVLAAAGNCVGFVVFPAAYDEVAAVAACDADRGIWKGTSRGPPVDVTAPGDRVWHAVANPDDRLDNVGQGSGTSFAVATVAGIAALWLAKHGVATIIQACGGREKIAPTFIQLLRSTATPVPGWPPGQFGGGLVNADALLTAPLPDGVANPLMLAPHHEHPPVGSGGLPTFTHLFDQALRAGPVGPTALTAQPTGAAPATLTSALSVLLHTTEGKLPVSLGQVGQELAFNLATDPALHRGFATTLSPPPTPDAGLALLRDRLLAKGVSPALAAKLRRVKPCQPASRSTAGTAGQAAG